MDKTNKGIELDLNTMEKVSGGDGGTAISATERENIVRYCIRLKAQNYTLEQAIAFFDSNYDYGAYGRDVVLAIVISYWGRAARC